LDPHLQNEDLYNSGLTGFEGSFKGVNVCKTLNRSPGLCRKCSINVCFASHSFVIQKEGFQSLMSYSFLMGPDLAQTLLLAREK